MRLITLTLMKDARRLWPVAGITCIMLAALANIDRWRSDWMVSPTEGWLNLLLSCAWACLAALAVLEDPLVGDRHLWMTRPHRWPALLGAKLVFVILAIHAPSFVADGFVLSARGFSPVLYVGELFTKQILFFACVILPAMAIASVVRSFTHFVVVLFALTACLAIFSGGLHSNIEFNRPASELRESSVRVLLAGTAVVVMCIQYARRATRAARAVGMAGGVLAAALFAFLPVKAEYAAHRTGAGIALRSGTHDTPAVPRGAPGRRHTVFVPITVTPEAQGSLPRAPLVEVEVVAKDGTVARSARPTRTQAFDNIDLLSHLYSDALERPPEWLVLSFSRSAWQRFENARVQIRGSAGLDFYRLGETRILPLDGSREIADVGRCTAAKVDDGRSETLLKVLCESPRDVPGSYVTLRHEGSQRVWRQGLNWAVTHSSGPNRTWLSPLERAQSFFRLTETVEAGPGGQWLVPASYLSSAQIEVTPVMVKGRALTRFEFADVTLTEASPRQ